MTYLLYLRFACALLVLLYALPAHGQQPGAPGALDGILGGTVSGSFQLDAAIYFEDTIIGTPRVPENMGLNAFGNITYQAANFSAGMRYETYLPPLLGIDPNYRGQGVPMRFASYRQDKFSITVGNFYEQFGSGMALRAWWEPLLGYDNNIDGVRVTADPVKGIRLKGVAGRQRLFFGLAAGQVRGADAEIDINTLLDSAGTFPVKVTVGGNFVSRFQPDNDPVMILPENVGISSGRMSLSYKSWNFFAEYAYKINDPNATNELIYRPGQGLLTTLQYSQTGFGFALSAKRLDNMDFRSDRNQSGQNAQINFLPPLAKQHTWRLPSLYVYATQPNGEMGIMADMFFKLKKDTPLGGKYGTTVSLNYSLMHSIDSIRTGNDMGYNSAFLSVGDKVWYQDVNLEISRKLSRKLKLVLAYLYIEYDKDQVLGLSGFGTVYSHTQVAELNWRVKPRRNLRFELQHMHTEQDFGSWAMALVEYTVAPHWSFSFMDEYNYGNEDPAMQVHYYSGNVAWLNQGTRISFGYGRQREGIICIGGICRILPATNGFMFSVSSTF